MKKSVLAGLGILTGVFIIASAAMAGMTAGTGIKGTFHDLSSLGAANTSGDLAEQTTGQNRICIYCHAPHHTLKVSEAAARQVNYVPLWNHQLSDATYVMYSAGTEWPSSTDHKSQAALELMLGNQPGGVSKLCLSCHDGTVATNEYGFAPSASLGAGDKLIGTNAPRALIGGVNGSGNNDLSNHHPIGFNYADAEAADNEIAVMTTALGQDTIGDLLWNGKMECTTCHDVHNTRNYGEKFLWETDDNSKLCLTCHLKADIAK